MCGSGYTDRESRSDVAHGRRSVDGRPRSFRTSVDRLSFSWEPFLEVGSYV